MQRLWGSAAIAVLVVAAGCTGESTSGPAPGMARVTVRLTDAPGDMVASAMVDIGAVQLVGGEGGPVTLTDDGGEHDLLDLQNGATATLATLDVPTGTYHQLRLIVDGASLTLVDGVTFRDGSSTKDLKVPSGAQTGIKINLHDGDEEDGVALVEGETIIVLDFDVTRNFVLTGPPGEPTGALFKPVVRASVLNIAGSISGTVTEEGTGNPVEGATVRAVLEDSDVLEELQTAEATATTAADGTFTIWFLSPGTYTVSVDGSSAPAQTVEVGVQEAVTGVNFVITP